MRTTTSHIRYSSTISALVLPVLIMASGVAPAADGILEINQECAAVGCFADDAAGFPVTISNAGSYILTSNLDVTGESNPETVTAIDVDGASGSTIDLNGFAILGPNSCTGFPLECTFSTGGIGIDAVEVERLTIRNGRIRGMGWYGVRVTGLMAKVFDLTVDQCGGHGIQVPGNSIVRDNIVTFNRQSGIFTGQTLVQGNILVQNGDWGVDGTSGTALSHNVFTANGDGNFDAGVQVGGNLCQTVLCP